MTPELHMQAMEVLADAQELDPEGRESFVGEACRGDEALRREVLSLLNCDELTVDILDGGPLPLRGFDRKDPAGGSTSQLYEGRRIGPYRVERMLDEGGMGTVALAVREDGFRQRVALKLIKTGMLSEEVLSRFRTERQILGRLEHPNIAGIHDGGTTEDGMPYFAMEYVEGETISDYCEARQLSTRGRLELFRKVCSAVQVAHQNLVVHRDLKPGNILVTSGGVPKLIDFGIAKPLGAELAAQSLKTTQGRSPMTPKYASPEQFGNERITPASDVYSLGVVLFQLLTGEFPYPVDSLSPSELERVICEVEPRKPSTAVWKRPERRAVEETAADHRAPERPGKPAPGVAERRRLAGRLAGDLDHILLKALRKEPRHRYGSVEKLSDDIRRHLEHLPVDASKGAFTYRAGKFIRRNRLALAVVLLILGSSVTTTVLWRRAGSAEEQAVLERDRATQALGLLKDSFKASNPNQAKGRNPTALDVLEEGKRKVEALEDPALKADVLDTLGSVYKNLGRYAAAKELLTRSLDIRCGIHSGDHADLAKAINNQASLHLRLGEFEQAEHLYREALAMYQRLGQEGETAKATCNLATTLMSRGVFEEAERHYQRCLRLREELYPGEEEVAMGRRSLGTLYYTWGRLDEAEPHFLRAHEILLDVLDPRHTKVALTLASLGRLRLAQKEYGEAEELLRQAFDIRRQRLDDDHPLVASSRRDLAELHLTLGQIQRAEEFLAQALSSFRLSKSADSWELADTESLLGACLVSRGQYSEAEPRLIESYRILEQARGPYAVHTRKALGRILELYTAWEKPEKASEFRAVADRISNISG